MGSTWSWHVRSRSQQGACSALWALALASAVGCGRVMPVEPAVQQAAERGAPSASERPLRSTAPASALGGSGGDSGHVEGPGCAHLEDIGPVREVPRPLGLLATPLFESQSLNAAMFCPSGFAYDAAAKMCSDGKQALGPFPQAMVDLCKASGGGPACDSNLWNLAFAVSIRGASTCPLGTATREAGLCAGQSAGGALAAFGPFTQAEVQACEAAQGGTPCRGMRWNLAFAESLIVTKDAAKPLIGLSVSLDSGHGGYPEGFEPGVMSPLWQNVTDYLFNLASTSEIADTLRRRGAKVRLFQYPEPFSGPELEGKGLRSRGSEVFVSLHHNGANKSAQGSEVFVHSSLASDSDRSLAYTIQDHLVAKVWNRGAEFDRGVKSADFGVLRGAAPGTPAAVLVEAFFIDTREQYETFEAWRRVSAEAIADGVTQYLLGR